MGGGTPHALLFLDLNDLRWHGGWYLARSARAARVGRHGLPLLVRQLGLAN